MDKIIYKLGFWAGLFAFASGTAFVVVQALQLADILDFPWDEILIYGFSLGIVIPFILEMLVLHHAAPKDKMFWSHAALIFTVLYGAFVTTNYVVQLATVIPAKIAGTAGVIEVLIQTPHSLFWDLDAIGYIFMGLATLFAVPVFETNGFQRWVRYSFVAHSMVTPLILIVYFYPDFSESLLLLAVPWGFTAPLVMLLLAIFLKNEMKPETIQ
jgi:hypothetical protein